MENWNLVRVFVQHVINIFHQQWHYYNKNLHIWQIEGFTMSEQRYDAKFIHRGIFRQEDAWWNLAKTISSMSTMTGPD